MHTWAVLGGALGGLGAVLGRSWGSLGWSCGGLGWSCGVLGALGVARGSLGGSWKLFGVAWGALGGSLGTQFWVVISAYLLSEVQSRKNYKRSRRALITTKMDDSWDHRFGQTRSGALVESATSEQTKAKNYRASLAKTNEAKLAR